ncbi:MAG: rod shape-determining protein MreD [Clostridiaceae bacterium]|nr:rod shape-determining protein MreD [Clostridiaceae bacterium]
MRKKIIFNVASIFILILVQTTILDYIKIKGIKPNLVLIYVICMSILEGSKEGAVIGFFSGLLQDIVSGKILGLYSLFSMYLGAIVGFASKKLYKDNILVVVVFTFFLTGFYECGVYFAGKIGDLQSQHFLYFLKWRAFPEALYNSVFSMLMYFLLLRINARINLESRTTKMY